MFSCEYLCLIFSSFVFRGLVHLWLLLILQIDNTERPLFCANHILGSARQKEHGKDTQNVGRGLLVLASFQWDV